MLEEAYEVYDWEEIKKDEGKYWEIGAIQEIEFQNVLIKKPSFARCFNKRYDLTHKFKSDIKRQTTGDNHVIITIEGRTGSGKSRVAQVIGKYICSKLSIQDIVFTDEELLARCERIEKNRLIIKDEHVIQHGIGSEREKGEIMNVEMVMRKFGLSLIFCSPIEFPHDTAHFRLEVLCLNRKDRKTKLGLKDKQGAYLGYIVIDIPDDAHDPLWMEYNEQNKGKKDKFIKDLKSRSLKRIDYKACSEKVMQHELYKKYNGKPNDQTLMFIIRDQNPNFADKEIYSIYVAYSNYYRQGKSKNLDISEIQAKCSHGDTRYLKSLNALRCRRCGFVIKPE